MSVVETHAFLTNRHRAVLRTFDGTSEWIPSGRFSWMRSELASCLRWGLVEARRLRKRRNVYRLTEHGHQMLAEASAPANPRQYAVGAP